MTSDPSKLGGWLHEALARAPDAVCVIDETGILRFVNAEAEQLLAAHGSLVGQPLQRVIDLIPDAWRPLLQNLLRSQRAGAPVQMMESGEVRLWYLPLSSGAYLLRIRDVTGERQMAAALAASEARYRLLAENARGYAVFMLDLAGQISDWNAGAERLLGYRTDEIVGKNIELIFVPEDRAHGAPERERDTAARKGAALDQRWHLRKDGSRFWADGVLTGVRDPKGELIGFAKMLRDDTERKLAEEALAEEKERLEVTLASIDDSVVVTDVEGRVLLMNRAAEKLTGCREENVRGQALDACLQLLTEDTRTPVGNLAKEVIERNERVEAENGLLLAGSDGRERNIGYVVAPMHQQGTVVGAVLVLRDVSARRRLESSLQQAERLEAIGRLAGGIAHDFNNILTAIFGNLTLAKLQLQPGDPALEALNEAERAFERARSLTQRFLTFARGGAPITGKLDLRTLLPEVAEFSLSGAPVKVDYRIADDLWPVRGDEQQLRQALTSVLQNARQAMPEGGTVQVEAHNQEQRSAPHCIAISIIDSGPGIAAEFLPKVFDPYFTTNAGRTGLGLTIAYSIVRRHHGSMQIESTPGVGTRVTLSLPAYSEPTPRVEGGPGEGRKCRILVMDDDAMVRRVLGAMLDRLGYAYAAVANGEEAVSAYEEAAARGEPFDLVILDLTVAGGLGGRETLGRLAQVDPGVRAVVSSGYAEDPIVAKFDDHGFIGVITKPYTLEELERSLADFLR